MAITRRRILTVAKAIHASAGEERLSMRRIAARLGVTAPAIYHHFVNRSEILEAISEEGFERLVHRVDRLTRRHPPAQQCLDVLVVYREFALDEPHLFAVMFLARRPRARQFPDDFAARRSAAFSLLADRVTVAIRAGDLREDDAHEVALTLWAHAHGLVLLQRAGRFGGSLAAYRRAFDRSLTRLIRGLAVMPCLLTTTD
jgi:AcrR family transcriptional regulator